MTSFGTGNPTNQPTGQSGQPGQQVELGSPPPEKVNDFHRYDDLDTGLEGHHHSLGKDQNQASPGPHVHNGVDSRRLTEYSPTGHDHPAGPLIEIAAFGGPQTLNAYNGNSFANYGGDANRPHVPLAYRKLANGLVVMKGRTFWNGSGSNPVCVISPGHRPAVQVEFPVYTNGGTGIAFLVIWSDGAVFLYNATGGGYHDMFASWYADV